MPCACSDVGLPGMFSAASAHLLSSAPNYLLVWVLCVLLRTPVLLALAAFSLGSLVRFMVCSLYTFRSALFELRSVLQRTHCLLLTL